MQTTTRTHSIGIGPAGFLREKLEASEGVTQLDGRTLLWEDSETLAFHDPGRPFEVSEIQVLQGGTAGLAVGSNAEESMSWR